MSHADRRTPSSSRARPVRGTGHVVAHVRTLIERRSLRPGDRLPAERDLARLVGVSRPTVRAGLRALAAMGVIEARRGSGTYIPAGPPALASEPLRFQAALHGFTREDMYEARRILEVGAAGLAAERATAEGRSALAEAVASLFATADDPQQFLLQDIAFHRALATASGNPILASMVEMVSALFYERRRETAAHATASERHEAAEMHRRIYQAVRAGEAEKARRAMHDHLVLASQHQAREQDTGVAGRRALRPAVTGTARKAGSSMRRVRSNQ